MMQGYRLDRPLSLACPECGGTLWCERVGSLAQYRCHIGHVLSAQAVLDGQISVLEHALGHVLALLNERSELCRRMAEETPDGSAEGELIQRARAEALDRANQIRDLLESEWLQPEFGAPRES